MLKIVRSAGADVQNILKVNIYLTNLKEDFAPMNKIYATVCILSKWDCAMAER